MIMTPWKKVRRELLKSLSDAFDRLNWKMPENVTIERPPRGFGDMAVPCHQFSKDMKMHPQKISNTIKDVIDVGHNFLSKVETKGAYLNFFVDNKEFCKETIQCVINEKEKWGMGEKKNVKVIVEHTSANPTGPLHVGRARNPILGDTLARILKFAGYDVETQYYVNDMGKQAATLYYGYKKYGLEDENIKYDHAIVKCYKKAAKEGDEKEINEILRKYEDFKSETHREMKEVLENAMKGISESLRGINVYIDKYVWESQFLKEDSANKILKMLCEKGVAKEENDGAFYIKMDDEKIFLTRKDGTSLYVLRDVAYHVYKLSMCDLAINILGEDHKFESEAICRILKTLGYNKCPEVIFYSFVSLPEGKMSTREGRTVILDIIIHESIARAYEEVKKRRNDLSDEKMKAIAKVVGIGAVKYNIIKVQPEKPIVFRWEDALSFEGNSAPYVQYAHARCCSILKKSSEYFNERFNNLNTYEIDLIKEIAMFPEVVENCAKQRRCHPLPSYLKKLVEIFNQFYIHVPVLKADTEDKRNRRLSIVESMKWTLRNGLALLGIDAPEEM